MPTIVAIKPARETGICTGLGNGKIVLTRTSTTGKTNNRLIPTFEAIPWLILLRSPTTNRRIRSPVNTKFASCIIALGVQVCPSSLIACVT